MLQKLAEEARIREIERGEIGAQSLFPPRSGSGDSRNFLRYFDEIRFLGFEGGEASTGLSEEAWSQTPNPHQWRFFDLTVVI